MKRAFPAVPLAFGALLLFWNLGRPALWQDEAETALRAESVLETGLPRMSLRGTLVTAQPSLAAHEGNSAGVWIWNTWLPAYLVAASFAVFGRTPFAARLPFALAGIWALWLSWRLFSDGEKDERETKRRRAHAPQVGLVLLAFSPAFLLFCRQSRYYALVALGTVLVLRAWRRLLAGKPWGVAATALSLQFLLHSSFAFFAAALLALALDAALRGAECLRPRRFREAALLTVALAAPAAWYFRIWDRPGNHAYGWVESLEFLKTFLLWLAAFSVPGVVLALASIRHWIWVAAGFLLLCGIVAEGPWSLAAGAVVWGALVALAWRQKAARGVMNLRRACLLLIAATLALLSFSAAEPYGRYLAGILPACAYLLAREISSIARGRAAAAVWLTTLVVGANALFLFPLKVAQVLAAPASPVSSVSGMMRGRLRDLGWRSDLALFAGETVRGAEGYIEVAAAAMRAGGGKTYFSDADELSLLFATGLRPMYPAEFASAEPDWILPSPWLHLSADLGARARELLASGRYRIFPVSAPRLLWQNNPDPLFRNFAPERGPLPLFRRRPD